VAVNRVWTNSEGVRQESTEWFNVVAWNRLAETCHKLLRKGHKVYSEGRLQTHSWEDQSGARHYHTEIVAQDMVFLGPRSRDLERGEPPAEESWEGEDEPSDAG
jgi:single-strand DNA-binding protein